MLDIDTSGYDDFGPNQINNSFSKVKLISTKKEISIPLEVHSRASGDSPMTSTQKNTNQKFMFGSGRNSMNSSPMSKGGIKRKESAMFGIPTVDDNSAMETKSRP